MCIFVSDILQCGYFVHSLAGRMRFYYASDVMACITGRYVVTVTGKEKEMDTSGKPHSFAGAIIQIVPNQKQNTPYIHFCTG